MSIGFSLKSPATLDPNKTAHLCTEALKTGIDFSYSFSGTDYHTGQKVQLGDVIEVRLTYRVSILGFGESVFPVTINASASGISQVYWK